MSSLTPAFPGQKAAWNRWKKRLRNLLPHVIKALIEKEYAKFFQKTDFTSKPDIQGTGQ